MFIEHDNIVLDNIESLLFLQSFDSIFDVFLAAIVR